MRHISRSSWQISYLVILDPEKAQSSSYQNKNLRTMLVNHLVLVEAEKPKVDFIGSLTFPLVFTYDILS